MKKRKVIGLLGLAFGSSNKGCEALGYGFLNVLESVAREMEEEFEIHIFEAYDVKLIAQNGSYDHLRLNAVSIPNIKFFAQLKVYWGHFKNCDYIFDFTAGDSFSDIYGMKRFVQRTIIKLLAEKSAKPFVLGSQTYGPYRSRFSRLFVRHVIRRATAVYARDRLSCDRIKQLTKRDADLTVDVAFAMQYHPMTMESERIKVGFNPSGLLWQGGYTRDNQFGLTVDYQRYCRELISSLLAAGKYDIYLIPHVISDDLLSVDNDVTVCRELKREFPQLREAPGFQTPVEVKSYISAMDVFIGARMHATIAAFTTGVPVIPFSYSPKFEGLFTSLGYNHIISATEVSTQDALRDTMELIEDRETIREELRTLEPVIAKGVRHLEDETKKILL